MDSDSSLPNSGKYLALAADPEISRTTGSLTPLFVSFALDNSGADC